MDRRKNIWFLAVATVSLGLLGAAIPMITGAGLRVGGSSQVGAGGDVLVGGSGSAGSAFDEYVPVELSSFRAVPGEHPLADDSRRASTASPGGAPSSLTAATGRAASAP